MSVFNIALAEAWAMREDALDRLLAIADRQHDVTPEALEGYRAEYQAKTERLRVIDDIAIVDIEGPLFKKANFLQAMCGASSYAIMARDFRAAIDDPKVGGVILNIDSPGGMVAGCDELAEMVFAARGSKPIIAYANGLACSAAYWIASSADSIILTDSTEVGSIGVIAGFEDRKEADTRAGRRVVEFVSSRAPGKRPDYDTDEGKAQIQRRIDNLESVFIAKVARNRGVSEDTVIKEFGAGGVEVGANAVKLKMADQVGSFDDAFAQATRGKSRRTSLRSKGVNPVTEKTGATAAEDAVFTQADLDKARRDGAAAATARIQAILGSDEAKGRETLASHLAYKTPMSADDAVATLKVSAKTAEPEDKPEEDADPAAAFQQRKEGGGALGYAAETGTPAAKDHGWSDVVASANKQHAR